MRSTFLALAALAQLALSSLADAEPLRIPLYRRTQNGVVTAAAEQLDNGVLAGKVYIGNPPQEFTMAFDTTTGFSWVRGSRCKSENCLDRCTYYARRSESAVSTGQKFKVDYGDACVDTSLYIDTVEFHGLSVEMPFGGAYRMSGFDDGFDGYLGLGREVNFNMTGKLHATSSNLMKRATLPSSAYVTNAYQQGTGLDSAQFGMVTTSNTGGFNQDGTSTTDPNQSQQPTQQQPNQQQPNQPTTPQPSTNATVPVASSSAAPAPQPSTQPTQPSTNTDGTSTVAPNDGSGGVTSGGFGFFKRTYEEEHVGYLVLGGVDKSLIDGEMEYIPLADTADGSAKNWDVCIKDANFDNILNIKQKPNAIAAISTSSPFIQMPADQADIFQEVFGLKYYEKTKTYGIKCSEAKNLPLLKLTIEDHVVDFPAKYWIREIDADRDCCGTRIRRGDSERDWILGTPFTNAFYTSFDPDAEAVGLGIKKGQEDDGLRVYRKTHH
ncbi:aspartic peptidase domain-containing protein [Phascolomyces articulosus]|uniref:Aspartic peptidase domain-containing protein n=1 Tax=Phascolomyces articulosus TaxID=60185 RepID=A0AAD5JQV9_9FUNG|nr:aspartic peptidase domain-containing protein [Phascolomyces articulosus]